MDVSRSLADYRGVNDLLLGLLLGYTAGTAGTLITFFLASVAGSERDEMTPVMPIGAEELPLA